MTHIIYNGVTIRDVLTEVVDQSAIYDKTNSDPIAIRTRVVVTGTLHIHNKPGGHGVYAQDGELGTGARALGELLTVPRRPFVMQIGNVRLFDIIPANSDLKPQGVYPNAQTDTENGPRTSVRFIGFQGEASTRVQFTIEFTTPTCYTSLPGRGSGILHMRWWIADDIDCGQWLTRRTYHGRIRTVASHINPHAFRGFAMPPQQPGFRRDRISFRGSEDNRDLEFTIEDQEIFAAPPAPATNWDGAQTLVTPTAGGVIAEADISVMVEAPKTVPKKTVINLASTIALRKMHMHDVQARNTGFLLSASVRDSFTANRVEINMRVRLLGTLSHNLVIKDFGLPVQLPNYNPELSTLAKPTATLAGLFLAQAQSACDPNTGFPSIVQLPPDRKPEKGKGEVEPESPGNALANVPDGLSLAHKTFVYNRYAETRDYDSDTGIRLFPVASGQRPTSGKTSVAIALHEGYTNMALALTAERLNAWPELPQARYFKLAGVGYHLARHRVQAHAPQVSADTLKTLHAVDLDYGYQLDRQLWPGRDPLHVGRLAFRKIFPNESYVTNIPPAAFSLNPEG